MDIGRVIIAASVSALLVCGTVRADEGPAVVPERERRVKRAAAAARH